ncbi:hypothetical protein BG003_008514 [Podila horticola]|nr:hypothetical protein BG003_008514 [Podila horticola]
MVLSVNPAYGLAAYAAGCVVVLYNYRLDKQIGLLCSSTIKRDTSSADPQQQPGSNGLPSGLSGTFGSTGTLSAQAAALTSGNSYRGVGGASGASSIGASPRAAASTQWLNNGLGSINPLAGLMPMAMADPSASGMSSFGSSNPNSNKNVKPKAISCLAFSPDGQFLAIGEMGHQPRILIWEVSTQTLVGELQGHKFGVQAVQFSPSSKHIVSLGFQHDGYIHVWNWRINLQIASNKVTTKVNAVAFSSDGSYFVTAGLRHIKFWYLNVAPTGKSGVPNVRVLDGRSGILGELRDSNYVDAACSQDGKSTYAVTAQGVLCLFSENRVMEKWIDLHVRGAYSLNLAESCVVCACADGIIRIFECESLQYIATLPKLSPVGSFAGSIHTAETDEANDKAIFADVLATQYDPTTGHLTCIYSDRSFVIWDITDPNNVTLYRSQMFHSDCVWGVEMFPTLSEDDQAPSEIPRDTFVTYSADGSIKFWNLDENLSLLSPSPDPESVSREHGPVLPSKEISRVLYVDETSRTWIQKPDIQDGIEPGFNVVPTECGIRTIKISADGFFIASGDKGGNLRVHDLKSFAQVTYQEAHDTEIMAIDFTDPQDKDSPFLVATAGRDRLLHVFDVHNNYALLQTLDDHSSSITTIKFTADGSRMLSCGADKSIIFRNRHQSADGITYQPYHQAPGRATFYDMDLHGQSQTVSAVSGDRRFTVFTLETGKPIKTFKAETKGDDLAAGMAEICSMTHISLDPTGTIAAASGSDKSVRLYDLIQGTCLAHMICHSELVTGVKFTNSYDRIISTSADGCILVWKLSPEVVRKIQIRIQENVTLPSRLQAKTVESAPLSAPGSTLVSPMVKPMKLKRSTDRLGAYSSEYSGTSRRNSTASVVSEDFDPRSEDNSDDWSDRTTSRVDARIEDLSKLNFTPVSTAKTPAHLPATVASGSRPRANSSYAKTPINRSRQNSYTQPTPTTPKHPGSSKLGSQPEMPPWNRNIVKEKLTPSSRSNRPPSPRQQVTKTLIKATSARPRARSMSVANDSPSSPNGVKAEGPSTKPPPLPRNLPKKPTEPRRHGHGEEDEDDELSDDTQSGFDDGMGVPPPTRALQNRMNNNTKASKGSSSQFLSSPSSKLADANGKAMMTRSVSVDNLAGAHSPSRQVPSSPSTAFQMDSSQARNVSDEDEDDDETVAEEASDERDGDDEINLDVDESMSDTGSDVERPSPLRIPGPASQQPSPAEDSTFHEGEFMLRSPKSSTITSPGKVSNGSSRVTSLRDLGMEGGMARRSLSAKFLTAHAATIMQSLISKDGREAQEVETGQPESAPVDEPKKEQEQEQKGEAIVETRADTIETNGDKPEQKAVEGPSEFDHSERPTSVDSKLSPRDSGSGLSLEEQLNPMSLNKAAMRRKQRSLGGGSKVLIQLGRGTDIEFNSNNSDIVSPISPTSDLSHRTFTGLTSAAQIVQETSNALPTTAVAQETDDVPERITRGILASPVTVKSPVNSHQHRRSVNLSSISDGFASSNHAWEGTGLGSGTSGRPPCGVYTRKVSKRLSVASSTNGDGADRVGSIAGITRSHESLQEAFDRISFLIAHKSNASQMEGKSVEEVKRAQQWMKETREGLLNLVGEAQGHLWALDKVVQGHEDKHM